MRTTQLLAALSIGLVACVGGIDDGTGMTGSDGSDGSGTVGPPPGNTGSDTGGGGSATARDYFNANVYPVISSTCGASSCHSSTAPGTNAPGFVNPTAPQTDSSAAWDTITGLGSVVGSFSASVPLLTVPNTTPHFAKFSTNQTTTITNWLALEETWRASSGSGGGTVTDYMAQFTGCMQYSDFVTAGVATAYAKQVNTNQGYCENCHVNGQAQSYMIATPDAQNMFDAVTTYREYMSTFFTVDPSTNQVIVNTIPFQLAADGGVNGAHPVNWNPTKNKGMTAVTQFYMLTVAHQNGTTLPACGASTLTD